MKKARVIIERIKEELRNTDVNMEQDSFRIAKKTKHLNDTYFQIAVKEIQIELAKNA